MSAITIIVAFVSPFFVSISNFIKPEVITPCSPPTRYQLGTIDKKFKIQEKTLLENLRNAEKIWEEPYGKELFVYDPEGTISASKRLININLVYDERQLLNIKIKQIEGNVKNENNKMKVSISDYEARVKALNNRSGALSEEMKNLDINDSNYSQKFDVIYKESQNLSQEAQNLNEIAATLNQSSTNYNREVGKLNETITNFNQALAQKPEEGLYKPDGNTIDIYMNNSKNELVHTLAHELGHTLGLAHTTDPKSIMYKFTSQYVKATGEDMNELQEACKERV